LKPIPIFDTKSVGLYYRHLLSLESSNSHIGRYSKGKISVGFYHIHGTPFGVIWWVQWKIWHKVSN